MLFVVFKNIEIWNLFVPHFRTVSLGLQLCTTFQLLDEHSTVLLSSFDHIWDIFIYMQVLYHDYYFMSQVDCCSISIVQWKLVGMFLMRWELALSFHGIDSFSCSSSEGQGLFSPVGIDSRGLQVYPYPWVNLTRPDPLPTGRVGSGSSLSRVGLGR